MLWAILFGGIALISQYLPTRVGIPIGIAATVFAVWQLGFGDFLAWQTWVVLVIALLVSIRLLLFFLKRKNKKADSIARIKQIKILDSEITERINTRMEYLPELKKTLNEYINRVEYLANNSDELIQPQLYKNIYLDESLKAEGKLKIALLSLTGVLYLYQQGVYKDNLALQRIEDTDKILNDLKTKMSGLNSFVTDSIVRTNVKGYPKASHIAYSYVVFNRFLSMHIDAKPFVHRFYYEGNEKALNRLRDLQNGTNRRIDELLEGAEDEL